MAQMCGIFTAHGTDETVCAVTYFLVYLLTSWCLANGYGKMKMKRKNEEVKSMKNVCFLLKLIVKQAVYLQGAYDRERMLK